MPSGSTPDGDLPQHHAALDVHHRHHVVVLVGDEQAAAVRVQRGQLRVGAGGQVAHHAPGLQVEHLHPVAVAGADVEVPPVARQRDAARPLAHGTVRRTRSVAPSRTVTVLSFSFETRTVSARGAAGEGER
jgi:hypothetical protein